MKKVHIVSGNHEILIDMKVDDHQIEVLEALQDAEMLKFEIVKNEQIESLLKSSPKTIIPDSEMKLVMETILLCFAMFFSIYTLFYRMYIEAIISSIMVVACILFACFLELKTKSLK